MNVEKIEKPADLDETLPYSSTRVRDLGKKLAVLSEADQKMRLDLLEGRGAFAFMPPSLKRDINVLWWLYVAERYCIDREKYPHVVYNVRDGIVYEDMRGK